MESSKNVWLLWKERYVKMAVGYVKTDRDIESVLLGFKEYEYALLYNMSNLILDKTECIEELDFSECLEAYLFSSDRMLHIFEEDGSLKAVELADQDLENVNFKYYVLHPRFHKLGKKLIIQEYLDYDEDGQMFVALTRLKGIE